MIKLRFSFGSLILFTLLILGSQGSSLETIINGYASLDGKVPIKKDTNGFYVEVDYKKTPTGSADSAKFLISLVSPRTILMMNKCLGFDSFVCSQHNCTGVSSTLTDVNEPYFSVKGRNATIEAYLDHDSWHLRRNAILADSCQSKFDGFGTGRAGIIGLAFDHGSWENYPYRWTDYTVLSILMKKDLSGGTLYFSRDRNKISESAKPINLGVALDHMWSTPTSSISIIFPDSNTTRKGIEGTVLFDVHADAIGLPTDMFNFVIETLKKSNVSCPTDKYKPVCSFSGKVSALPTLKLEVKDKLIPIPPAIYLQDSVTEVQQKITLNFKALDPTLTGKNYVTNYYFTNRIILDSNFMSYYYIVYRVNAIELYGPASPSESHMGWAIGMGVFLGIVACCWCIYRTMKLNGELEIPDNNLNESMHKS